MESGKAMLMVENNKTFYIPLDLQVGLGFCYWDLQTTPAILRLTTLGEAYVNYWCFSGKLVWIKE